MSCNANSLRWLRKSHVPTAAGCKAIFVLVAAERFFCSAMHFTAEAAGVEMVFDNDTPISDMCGCSVWFLRNKISRVRFWDGCYV